MIQCQTIMSRPTPIKEESEDLFSEILNQQHGLALAPSTPTSLTSFSLDEQFIQQHLQQQQQPVQQQQHLSPHQLQQFQQQHLSPHQLQQLQKRQQLMQQSQQLLPDDQFLQLQQLMQQGLQQQQLLPQQHGSQQGSPTGGSPFQQGGDQDYSGEEGRTSRGSMDTGTRASPGKCKVCGEEATGMYFGALVCVPCKTFFLRYSSDKITFVCKAQKNCEMTVTSRTQCKFCRYQKCLSVGMYRKIRPADVQPSNGEQLCAVCHDLANGIHFGAMTCEGCKKFFRRGLTENRTYNCKGVKDCIINPRTRNLCRYCRYQTCLRVGMSREAIQMGRPSKIPATSVHCSAQRAKFGNSSKNSRTDSGNGSGWTLQDGFRNNQSMGMDMDVLSSHQQAGMVGFDPRLTGQRLNSGDSFQMSTASGSFSPSGSMTNTESGRSASTDSGRSFLSSTSPPDMVGHHGRSWVTPDHTADGSLTATSGVYNSGRHFGSPFKSEKEHLTASHEQFLSGNLTGNFNRPFVHPSTTTGFTFPTSTAAHGASSQHLVLTQPSTQVVSQRLPNIPSQTLSNLETAEAFHILEQWLSQQHQQGSSTQATLDMLLPFLQQATQIQSNGDGFGVSDLSSLRPTLSSTHSASELMGISSTDLLHHTDSGTLQLGRSDHSLTGVGDFDNLLSTDDSHLSKPFTSQFSSSILGEALSAPTGTLGGVISVFPDQFKLEEHPDTSHHTGSVNFMRASASSTCSSDQWSSLTTSTLSNLQQTSTESDGRSSHQPDTSSTSSISASFQLNPEASAKDVELLIGKSFSGPDISPIYSPEPRVEPDESFIIDGHITLEEQIRQSWHYWRNLPRPEVVMVKISHFEVVNQILASYNKFVQLGANINRKLTRDFAEWIKNRNVDDCLEHLSSWIQTEVVTIYTLASITYLKGLPGFTSFHDEDQGTLIRLGQSQSRILVAAIHWYDAEERNFKNFMSWREFKFGPEDPYKRKLIDYAEKISALELDPVESALLNVLAILATDYPGLKRPDLIEASQKRILVTFEAYITAKFGSSNNRLESIFSYIPEVRRLGLIHYKMTLSPNLGVTKRTSKK